MILDGNWDDWIGLIGMQDNFQSILKGIFFKIDWEICFLPDWGTRNQHKEKDPYGVNGEFFHDEVLWILGLILIAKQISTYSFSKQLLFFLFQKRDYHDNDK